MDKLLQELGMNENTIIEDTHKCIGQSESKRKSFDQRFRRHIVHARDMLDVPAHQHHSSIAALKRSLEDDQEELRSINEQMTLCRSNIMSYLKIQVAEFCAKVRVGMVDGGDTCNVDSMTSFIGAKPPSSASVGSFIDTKSSQPQPGASTDKTASIAELGTNAERLVPSAMSQSFHQPEPASPPSPPAFTTITLQPPAPLVQAAPISAFIQPQRPYLIQQQQQQQQQLSPLHEIGMQRHFENAPSPSNSLQQPQPSVLYQPHLETHPQTPLYRTYASQSFSYRQPLADNRLANFGEPAVRQNYQMFRQQSAPPSVMNEAYHGLQEQQHISMISPQVNYFQHKPAAVVLPAIVQQQPQQFVAFHSSPVVAYPQPQFHARAEQKHITSRPYPFINYQAVNPIIASFANNNNNKKVSNADHHHSSTSNEQEEKDDSPSSLWFPGTTYSPPPSWLNGHSSRESSKQLSVPNQSQYPNYSPVIPFTPPGGENHPVITQISGEKHKEGEPGEVAPYSSLKPYNPFTQQRTDPAEMPIVHPFVTVPVVPITNTFASPQHEVIKSGPPNEVVTVNQASASPSSDKPEQREEHNGPLPGYVGAVDLAKYPEDSTDRMRPDKDKNKDEDKGKIFLFCFCVSAFGL